MVLVLTDRTELDEQIKGVFLGVDEKIYRTASCRDLVTQLNTKEKWLMCSLIHKFGWRTEASEEDIEKYVSEVTRDLPAGFEAKGDPAGFEAKGDIVGSGDECH